MATKKKHWIQNALHPSKKGACTPMTKKTCTPARKAFAKRAKAHKLQTGGQQPVQLAPTGAQGAGSIPDLFGNQLDPRLQDLQTNADINPGSFVNTGAGQKMMSRYTRKADPYIKGFNGAATLATNIGDSIQGGKLRREEYLQTLQSMTPKFMSNPNQGGLNNIPAYTMLGGPDRSYPQMELGGEFDYMMLGGTGDAGQYDYSHKSNEDYGREGIAHNAFYGDNSIYRAGGSVTSAKAKEILRDGTVHGQALTDKQKRYFGWIAGGKKMLGGWGHTHTGGMQAGGQAQPQPASQYDPNNPLDKYYGANATLSYYKNKLNEQLKTKNPQAYGDYFKGLRGARTSGQEQSQQYIQNSQYNEYLSPEEVKKSLGDKDYQNYLNSLKAVNDYNVGQKQQPLYGNIEGESDDPSKLNYGRRFASLPVVTSLHHGQLDANGQPAHDRDYGRDYEYDPKTGQIVIKESGNLSSRPQEFTPAQQQTSVTSTGASVTSRRYGGRKYTFGGGVQGRFTQAYHNTPYEVGQEVDLTAEQIKQLKKQGYKIKTI